MTASVLKARPAATKKVAASVVRYDDVPALAIKKGVPAFWADRIRSMANHAATVTGTPNGDRTTLPFTSVRFTSPKSWPIKGAITLTRSDGVTFTLRKNVGGKFVVKGSG